MGDLYRETSTADTADPGTRWEPGPGVGSRRGYEAAEPEGKRGAGHAESDAETEARIAAQDELPSRADSRQATWGGSPDYYDGAELGAEDDSDVEASLIEDDDLPSRQESRADTWGDDPEYSDETGPDEHDDEGSDATVIPEDPRTNGGQDDADEPAGDGAAPASQWPDDPATEGSGSSAEASAEQGEYSRADSREDIAELRAENVQRSRDIAELRAENADLQARLERLERASQPESAPGVSGREYETEQRASTRRENPKPDRWHLPTDEALALGAAATGGVLTTVSDYVPYLHADIAGISASAVAVGAAGLTWIRARREAKHAGRTKD